MQNNKYKQHITYILLYISLISAIIYTIYNGVIFYTAWKWKCTEVSFFEGIGVSENIVDICKKVGAYDPSITDTRFSEVSFIYAAIVIIPIIIICSVILFLLVRDHYKLLKEK